MIKVVKPEILYNKYHLEHEEKEVVEPLSETSEEVHGGDEITESIQDQRFAQQSEHQQTETQQSDQYNNNNVQTEQQQNENHQNNKIQKCQKSSQSDNNQTEDQNDNSTDQENETENETEQENKDIHSQQQTGEQQNNDNKQSRQQNEREDSNETNSQQTEQQDETQQNELNDTEDETEDQTLDDSASDDYQEQEAEEQDEDYDDEEDEDQEDGDTTYYNTEQAFKINGYTIKNQLYLAFYTFIEYLSDEENQTTLQPGSSLILNIKKLMIRQYERKPLNAYYYYKTRSQVILILDNSGSMAWLMNELNTFFKAALKRKDVQIYVAPNGQIEEYYNDKTKQFEVIDHGDAIQQIIRSSLPVIYIGDFDGANTAIELSWSTRLYWICTEKRYKYFRYHSSVQYNEEDFKGFFGRAFNGKEMVTVLKEFAKNILKQYFWYDKHDIKDFSDS
jgi:chemotaxis protein histidine kinase CheA